MSQQQTTPTQEQIAARMEELRSHIENMIKKTGYCIMAVIGDDNNAPYIYTYGRNDIGKPDLFIPNAPGALYKLVKECIDIIDNGGFKENEVYTSNTSMIVKDQSAPIKFKLTTIDPKGIQNIALGMFNRGQEVEDVKVIQVTVADEYNQF